MIQIESAKDELPRHAGKDQIEPEQPATLTGVVLCNIAKLSTRGCRRLRQVDWRCRLRCGRAHFRSRLLVSKAPVLEVLEQGGASGGTGRCSARIKSAKSWWRPGSRLIAHESVVTMSKGDSPHASDTEKGTARGARAEERWVVMKVRMKIEI